MNYVGGVDVGIECAVVVFEGFYFVWVHFVYLFGKYTKYGVVGLVVLNAKPNNNG